MRERRLGDVDLTAADYAFTNKILSSDALAAQLITRIKHKQPTSVIRMSDGERGIMRYADTKQKPEFLLDSNWLKRYGLAGYPDLMELGRRLQAAGNDADYLGCTISGTFWPCFRVHDRFNQRKQFIDVFYPKLWQATDRVYDVLAVGRVIVLHHDAEAVAAQLQAKYGLAGVAAFKLSSWADQPAATAAVIASKASTVVMSGGPSGKPFAVLLAKAAGVTVLDVGEALTGSWV